MSRRKGRDDIPELNPYPGRISNADWRAFWLWDGQGWTYQEVADDLHVTKTQARHMSTHARVRHSMAKGQQFRNEIIDRFDALIIRVANEPPESWNDDVVQMREDIAWLQRMAKDRYKDPE